MSETPTQPAVEAEQPALDPFDAQVVLDADGVLADLNRAGLLGAADVHVTRTVARLSGEDDEDVLLALALAVRAVRLGSSCVQLDVAVADLREEAPDVEWPSIVDDLDRWWQVVEASPLAHGLDRVLEPERPLLHLSRYHALEVSLCERLVARLHTPRPVVDETRLDADLTRLFVGDSFAEQRAAAAAAAGTWTSVLTGGPGTGKTTTIARLLAALAAQHRATGATRPLGVGLAAPTGKAAARLREAIAGAAADDVFTDQEREWLGSLQAVTLHRLLGYRPGHHTRFRHDAQQKLPYDVVVVDETSMVSLLMMERLVQAVPASCRLVLVGDAEQLASVEAGAVLRDVVEGLSDQEGASVTTLQRGHRFSGTISDLAHAVVEGDADRVLTLLDRAPDDGADEEPEPGDVRFVDTTELTDADAEAAASGRAARQARDVAAAAQAGDVDAALRAMGEHRLLCAHRDGPYGVSSWNERLEREVRLYADPSRPWYPGRPVVVTRNDSSLRVNNGDVGVAVESGERLLVHLDTDVEVAASRLSSAQSAYASTVHRSQGSEFDHVTLVLPDEGSLVLTRELLYTAITRARRSLTIVATPEVVRRAVERRTARASGVARRLASMTHARTTSID